jgi:hypothetical protein
VLARCDDDDDDNNNNNNNNNSQFNIFPSPKINVATLPTLIHD